MLKWIFSTVLAGPVIYPRRKFFVFNESITFTASGGIAPYIFSIVFPIPPTNGGTINPLTGDYTAPPGPTEHDLIIRVTHFNGNTSDSTCYVGTTATITIANGDLEVEAYGPPLANDNVITYTATGGTSSYTWSIIPEQPLNPAYASYIYINEGPGETGNLLFQNPGTFGDWTGYSLFVRCTDTFGNFEQVHLAVYAHIIFTNANETISLEYDETYQFYIAGGKPPYIYSVNGNPSGLITQNGLYTAPGNGATPGNDIINYPVITDSLSYSHAVPIEITTNLNISPDTLQYLETNGTLQFTAIDGIGPYLWQCTGNSIIDVNGLLTADNNPENITVTVTDDEGFTADCSVSVTNFIIIPTSKNVVIDDNFQFSVVGGASPIVYSKISGVRSIKSNG